jgi:hypothetical protein
MLQNFTIIDLCAIAYVLNDQKLIMMGKYIAFYSYITNNLPNQHFSVFKTKKRILILLGKIKVYRETEEQKVNIKESFSGHLGI